MLHLMSIDDDVRRWALQVPGELRGDVMWTAAVFRYACFASDYLERDIRTLAQNPTTAEIASQLSRSVGSISAHFAEGYSRASSRDRCRVYEYGLGEAREARQWIFRGRRILGEERSAYGMALLTTIIRMLTVIIRNERRGTTGGGPRNSRRE